MKYKQLTKLNNIPKTNWNNVNNYKTKDKTIFILLENQNFSFKKIEYNLKIK